MPDIADRYVYRVTWSEDDGEFVATCAELPSVSLLDPNRVKALSGLVSLVRAAVLGMEKDGETPPVPIVDQKYSGELRVRLPPVVHQRLAIEAAERSTSMNRVIIEKLS